MESHLSSLPSFRKALGAVLVAAVVGCGDDGTGPTVAAKLAFTVQPADAQAGASIAPAAAAASKRASGNVITAAVAIQDASGNVVTTATNAVTIAIGANPAGGTLSGTTTVSAVNGVANFSDLEIDRLGTDYTLVATSGTLTSATSVAFDVVFGFQSVSAGYSSYTCGLSTGGEAYCWGGAKDGRLGDGTTNSSKIPVAVVGGLSFQSVSAGFDHTCGVATDGAAYCWGASGRLGDGTNNSSTTPVAVAGGLTFQSVSNGVFHSCALTTGGQAYCWGVSNNDGQFGDGTTNSSTVPVAVAGGLTFQSVSAGGTYTCALTTGGEAYCWGSNSGGELGNGTTTNSTVPVAVAGGLTFQSVIAEGGSVTCGLTTGGEVFCWGNNGAGQFGNGTTTNSTMPVAAAGGLTLQSLSIGQQHACGVTTAGDAYCWGSGPLGNATTGSSTVPVAVVGGLTFASVSAGSDHTCGVTTGGPAYCWGSGISGRLGNGTTDNKTTPTRVSDPQ